MSDYGYGGRAAPLDQSLFKELVKRYHEPHRRYHDINHIYGMLSDYERYRSVLSFSDTTTNPLFYLYDYIGTRTIWYHDVIYDAAARDNEEKSAEFVRATEPRDGKKIYPSTTLIEEIVLMTKKHVVPVDWQTSKSELREMAAYVLSLDLLGFASDLDVVLANGKKIRAEYSHLTDAEWKGRTSFLETFLERTPFFPHPFFEETMAEKAKHNIRAEIEFWKTA